jgi:hypothetical protein
MAWNRGQLREEINNRTGPQLSTFRFSLSLPLPQRFRFPAIAKPRFGHLPLFKLCFLRQQIMIYLDHNATTPVSGFQIPDFPLAQPNGLGILPQKLRRPAGPR